MATAPKKLDATAEDLQQNKAINAEAKATATAEKVDESLERRVANLEAQVNTLAPLAGLLGHITQIRRHFGFGGG